MDNTITHAGALAVPIGHTGLDSRPPVRRGLASFRDHHHVDSTADLFGDCESHVCSYMDERFVVWLQ